MLEKFPAFRLDVYSGYDSEGGRGGGSQSSDFVKKKVFSLTQSRIFDRSGRKKNVEKKDKNEKIEWRVCSSDLYCQLRADQNGL